MKKNKKILVFILTILAVWTYAKIGSTDEIVSPTKICLEDNPEIGKELHIICCDILGCYENAIGESNNFYKTVQIKTESMISRIGNLHQTKLDENEKEKVKKITWEDIFNQKLIEVTTLNFDIEKKEVKNIIKTLPLPKSPEEVEKICNQLSNQNNKQMLSLCINSLVFEEIKEKYYSLKNKLLNRGLIPRYPILTIPNIYEKALKAASERNISLKKAWEEEIDKAIKSESDDENNISIFLESEKAWDKCNSKCSQFKNDLFEYKQCMNNEALKLLNRTYLQIKNCPAFEYNWILNLKSRPSLEEAQKHVEKFVEEDAELTSIIDFWKGFWRVKLKKKHGDILALMPIGCFNLAPPVEGLRDSVKNIPIYPHYLLSESKELDETIDNLEKTDSEEEEIELQEKFLQLLNEIYNKIAYAPILEGDHISYLINTTIKTIDIVRHLYERKTDLTKSTIINRNKIILANEILQDDYQQMINKILPQQDSDQLKSKLRNFTLFSFYFSDSISKINNKISYKIILAGENDSEFIKSESLTENSLIKEILKARITSSAYLQLKLQQPAGPIQQRIFIKDALNFQAEILRNRLSEKQQKELKDIDPYTFNIIQGKIDPYLIEYIFLKQEPVFEKLEEIIMLPTLSFIDKDCFEQLNNKTNTINKLFQEIIDKIDPEWLEARLEYERNIITESFISKASSDYHVFLMLHLQTLKNIKSVQDLKYKISSLADLSKTYLSSEKILSNIYSLRFLASLLFPEEEKNLLKDSKIFILYTEGKTELAKDTYINKNPIYITDLPPIKEVNSLLSMLKEVYYKALEVKVPSPEERIEILTEVNEILRNFSKSLNKKTNSKIEAKVKIYKLNMMLKKINDIKLEMCFPLLISIARYGLNIEREDMCLCKNINATEHNLWAEHYMLKAELTTKRDSIAKNFDIPISLN